MDDLIKIKGVGAATAKKLTEAGIVSFAALAQLNAEAEPLASIAQTPEQAQVWIASAIELAKALPQDNEGQSGTNTEGGTGAGSSATSAKPKATLKVAMSDDVMARLAKAEDGTTVITVIGPSKGLRRAGHLFGSTPSTIRVTPDELKLIEADPGLAVTPGDASKVTYAGGAPATRLTVAECLDAKGKPLAIRVLGPASGRRRGGHAFGASPVTLTPSKEQLGQILGDAELSVALA